MGIEPVPGNQTLLTMHESLDGPWIAKLYPSKELAEADTEWLKALKRAVEETP